MRGLGAFQPTTVTTVTPPCATSAEHASASAKFLQACRALQRTAQQRRRQLRAAAPRPARPAAAPAAPRARAARGRPRRLLRREGFVVVALGARRFRVSRRRLSRQRSHAAVVTAGLHDAIARRRSGLHAASAARQARERHARVRSGGVGSIVHTTRLAAPHSGRALRYDTALRHTSSATAARSGMAGRGRAPGTQPLVRSARDAHPGGPPPRRRRVRASGQLGAAPARAVAHRAPARCVPRSTAAARAGGRQAGRMCVPVCLIRQQGTALR
jgi:hypothetical protein